MNRRYFFRDGKWMQGIIIATIVATPLCALALTQSLSDIQRLAGFVVVDAGIFLVATAYIVVGTMALCSEGARFKEDHLELLGFAGRVRVRIPYSEIESFRQDGFGERDRFFALIAGRIKIRVSERMPHFRDFASQLLVMHFGESVPQPYPVWGDSDIEPVKAAQPYKPPTRAVVALVIWMIVCVAISMAILPPGRWSFLAIQLVIGLVNIWRVFRAPIPEVTPALDAVVEW